MKKYFNNLSLSPLSAALPTKLAAQILAAQALTILTLAALTLTACQGKNSASGSGSDTNEKSKVSPAPIIQADSQFKPKEVKYYSSTGITVTTEEVTQESLAQLKQEAQLTALTELPISPGYNTNMFAISNDEMKNYAFTAPKIYAYSTNDGARMAMMANDDGTVSIPFHVAMISGFDAKISDPSGRGLTEPLPETYLVKNSDKLMEELHSVGKEKVSVLPGCVKRLVLKVIDREYDVTPADLSVSDFCDISKPFTVALRVQKNIAQFILQEALYKHVVDLRADFQTRVPYLVARVQVEFDKNRIYDELEVHFKANYKGIASVDARSYMEQLLKRQVMSVNIVGDYSLQLQAAVDSAMKMFFKEIPDVQKVEMDCAGSMACLTINKDHRDFSDKLSFFYQQMSSTLAGKVFTTTTRLQPLADKVVEIGDASSTKTQQNLNKPALKNDGTSIETGLTVQDGDILEIEPTYLTIEQRQLDVPTTTKQDNYNNNVCVRYTERQVCHRAPRSCVNRNAGPEAAFCGPAEGECEMVSTCAQTENQFIQTTTYSMGLPSEIKVDHPTGKFEQIYEGLMLKFSFTAEANGKLESKEITCPLKVFQREGEGQRISVRLTNQPGCEIFGNKKQNNPMLHLINGIRFPLTYKAGQDRVNWRGQILEAHTELPYIPAVGFGGRLTIRGYQIGNELLK